MTTPISTHIGEVLETMRDTVVEFGFVRIGFGVGLSDTLGDDLGITLFVAGVIAVRALHASSILEELAAESTTHNVVELLLHKFVTVLFDHLFLSLTNSAFPAESNVKWRLVTGVFGFNTVSAE